MKTLRADLLQPLAAVHQTSSPALRAEPVLGLQRLAGEVALAVDDGLRLARGSARERDQRRLAVGEVGVRRRAGGARRVDQRDASGTSSTGQLGRGRLELGAVALVADDRRGPRRREPQPQVLGAQLLGAREHDA